MRCPFCAIAMHPVPTGFRGHKNMIYNDAQGGPHNVEAVACPECAGIFLTHSNVTYGEDPERGATTASESAVFVLWPRVSSRPSIAAEVPDQYGSLAREAGFILEDSPRASAALSRRCLQQLLRNEAKAPPGKLFYEIEWALANADLPSRSSGSLHALREIGNMAARPNKGPDSDDHLTPATSDVDGPR